ncbi:3,4-dihydroxy-2-butanone-4-phosphate synthase [Saccharopolyspora mangrovi]|uniref:3,4-dihydroxy-2-butanone 4-phosphate synthase n=1 Tax=Saccharopolyspora mangrovi TaxID=3082379 RepID=A0ABU6AIQ8_9PSEU|nr:3,4-dihydroxy-2-butanone-4-phosphate synthase [Saccharopolyspora sp. S2-29]MEB3371373.1 3,4-dihydroxy-2-butanone-4-phosphate synthase [Saccharopolyspora sp. S2-29]
MRPTLDGAQQSGPRLRRCTTMKTFPGTVERAVAAIGVGEMVIVVDSADRENEGDLVMAAQHVSARHVHFMATEGRGLICAPMTAVRLAALQIEPMGARNTNPAGTAFHMSVDVRSGTTTGISASDRASTIRALADPDARAEDFSRPGHVFPLGARDGGVLERVGHTEAAIDLVKLAGLDPVAVICEITDDDGEMARMPTLVDLAERHGITIVTIAELAAYRRRTETLICRAAQARLPAPCGEFTAVGYRDKTDGREHIALVCGDVTATDHLPVHIHTECLAGDVFGSLQCDCGAQLQRAFDLIVDNGAGVVVYLREGHGRRRSLQCPPVRQTLDYIETQILADLGVVPDAMALFPDPLDASVHATADAHGPCGDTDRPKVPSTNIPARAASLSRSAAESVHDDVKSIAVRGVQVVGR